MLSQKAIGCVDFVSSLHFSPSFFFASFVFLSGFPAWRYQMGPGTRRIRCYFQSMALSELIFTGVWVLVLVWDGTPARLGPLCVLCERILVVW